MFLGKALKSLVAVGYASLLLGSFYACSDDSSSADDNTTIIVDPETGDTSTVVIDPVTGDTNQLGLDSIRVIDPETGDTVIKIDTIYIPMDTTLTWVGNSALIISEIMPVNLDWLDEEGGDPGWVEIYNAGDVAANLKGYALIENRKNGRKWVFGDELIPAKGFRIVFCDKKNLSEAPKDTELGHGRPHTNWKLEKDGGTIYLVDRYYGIRDSVVYPELSAGVSWGIVNGGAWKYFDKPTPEQPNNKEVAYDGLAPEFSFSGAQGGFYNEPVKLNPPSTGDGLTVRCTQDGSMPTKASPEFNQTITIEKNTTLRCAAFKDGLLTKKAVTNTYFIGESVNMPVVAVSVDPSFFEKHYVKASTDGCGPKCAPAGLYEDVEFPIHVEFFEQGDRSEKKAWEIDAGISLMGGWSRLENKKSVAVVMREEYETGWLHYPLFKARSETNSKFKGFNLRNNGNRFVSDYMADALGGALLEGSGVDYQRSRQVVVFYNGKYYGIHDMRERFNKNFVETNYGIDASSVNFVKHISHEVTASNGTTADYLAMLQFIGAGDMTVAENYEMAKALIDVGNFADYMIAEIYYHNGDWPNNNVRAWKAPDHPWKFMVYDLDHGFDWKWEVEGFGQEANMFKWIKKGGGGDKPCLEAGCFPALYNSLIKNPNFKRLFVNHASVMLENYLTGARADSIAQAMYASMDPSDIDRDKEKYKERRQAYGDFDEDGSGLVKWMKKRDGVVREEFQSEFGLTGQVSMTIAASGNGTVLMEGMTLPGNGTYKGNFFAGVDMELMAVPAAGSVFAGWSDGVAENPRLVTPADGLSITATFK